MAQHDARGKTARYGYGWMNGGVVGTYCGQSQAAGDRWLPYLALLGVRSALAARLEPGSRRRSSNTGSLKPVTRAQSTVKFAKTTGLAPRARLIDAIILQSEIYLSYTSWQHLAALGKMIPRNRIWGYIFDRPRFFLKTEARHLPNCQPCTRSCSVPPKHCDSL